MPRSRLPRRSGWAALAAVLLAGGCARIADPPGGPPDTTPPEVVAVSPESLAVGVPPDAAIRITFSEKVDANTLEKAIWVTPGGLSKPQIDVSGETVTIRSRRPFPDSTTIGVLVTSVARDRRQNRLPRGARWIFTTGDSVWPGTVRGKAERVGGDRSAAGLLLVGLYPGDGDTLPDPRTTAPVAVAEADTSGEYTLTGLPVDGHLRWLYGMYDRDGNREISGTGEFVSARPESIALTPSEPERVVPLTVVDPQAPGILQGTLTRAEGDTVDVWLELYTADADSAAKPARRTQAAPTGAFSFRQVPPGNYRLFAFCDADQDGKHGADETAAAYGEVTISPGETRELGSWEGPRCSP